jgi:peroxiredoxin Q/BCP
MSKAASGTVSLGKKVPDFTAATTEGGEWRLKEALGSKVVLFFYPKDMTPGCTIEAGTLVVGVSRDSCSSHQKFRTKELLNYELLSDADEALCRLFDVIKEKNMYGKKVFGIERSTFLIDAKGVLAAEWRKVKAEGHAATVLVAAKAL